MKTVNKILTWATFAFSSCAPVAYGAQTVFTDPTSSSCTDLAPSNTGNGTCTITNPTAFIQTETYTFTATTSGAGATFSVAGSLSGSLGNVTAGSSTTVYDAYGFPRFTVALSNGGTPYVAGDNFTFTGTAGTELKKSNFDLLTLAQICSNGCSAGASLTANAFISSSSNPASAGQVRLANADTIKFRNSGNSADVSLAVGSSDSFASYAGVDLANISTAQTLTNKTISGASNTLSNIADGSLSTSYLKADGTRALTGNWGAGAFSGTFNSVAVGSSANTISALRTIASDTSLTFQANGSTTFGSLSSAGLWTLGDSGSSQDHVMNGRQFSLRGTNTGGGQRFIANNTSNANTAADAVFLALTGGASGGNPYVDLRVSGVTGFAVGIDNADSDIFKISYGSAGVGTFGTNDYFKLNTSGGFTIGAASGTQTHAINGNFTSTGTGAVSGTALSGVNLTMGSVNALTTAIQIDVQSRIQGSVNATTEIDGFVSTPTTSANSFNAALITGFRHSPRGLGAGSTATRVASFYSSSAPTQGSTGNAILADNNSWSGNYFLNSTNTNPTLISGEFQINTAGKGISIKEGSNAKLGTCTLVLGTCTVSTTAVTANSRIFLTAQSLGTITVPVGLAVSARTAATSFVILSGDLTDTSVVAWPIIEPL